MTEQEAPFELVKGPLVGYVINVPTDLKERWLELLNAVTPISATVIYQDRAEKDMASILVSTDMSSYQIWESGDMGNPYQVLGKLVEDAIRRVRRSKYRVVTP